MKTLLFLSLFFGLALFSRINAQVTSVQIFDSLSFCNQKSFSLYFEIGAQNENNPTINVDWGDGTTSSYSEGVYYANNAYYHPFFHEYTIAGTFTITSSITSSVNSEVISANEIVQNIIALGECGYIFTNVRNTGACGNGWANYIYTADLELIDVNNNVSTFQYGMTSVNVNNGPYTIRISDDWLMQNNFTQTSADIIVSGFDQYGYPTMSATELTVESTLTSLEADYLNFYAFGAGYSVNQVATVHLGIGNQSCIGENNVRVNLTIPADLTPIVSNLVNAQVNGNILSFDVDLTNNFGWVNIQFDLSGTTQAGIVFDLNSTLVDLDGLETITSNNSLDFSIVVFNSYDPNNKTVNRGQNINPNEQEELIYTVEFQNEGNFEALNVRVLDTLSSNLDFSTFKVIDQKHNLVTTLNPTTGVVDFKFNNINLAPKDQDEEGSKGFVTYSIKEKANLPVDSEIENTAYIYFDFNPAIITNTTYNKNALLNVSKMDVVEFQVYPNPVKDKLIIESRFASNDLILLDLNGKIILKQTIGFKGKIDLSTIENGVYYLQITNEKTNAIQKIIVTK